MYYVRTNCLCNMYCSIEGVTSHHHMCYIVHMVIHYGMLQRVITFQCDHVTLLHNRMCCTESMSLGSLEPLESLNRVRGVLYDRLTLPTLCRMLHQF